MKKTISALTAFLIALSLPGNVMVMANAAGPDNAPLDKTAISPWAESEAQQGIALGFVPISIREDYQRPISRGEFAKMAVCFLSTQYGYQPEYIFKTFRAHTAPYKDFSMRDFKNAYAAAKSDRNGDPFQDIYGNVYSYDPNQEFFFPDTPFTDTDAYDDRAYVNMAYHMGIVNGMSEAEFDPTGKITRQEAAVMLLRVYANYAPPPASGQEPVFSDDMEIADWARESVYCMAHTGVMQGTGDDRFTPLGEYTTEQAIVSFTRLYHAMPVSRKNRNIEPLLSFDFERARYFEDRNSSYFHRINTADYSDFELVYGYWTRRHRQNDHALYLFCRYGGMRELSAAVNTGLDNISPIEDIRVSTDEQTIAFVMEILDSFTLYDRIDSTEHVYEAGKYKLEFDVEKGALLSLTRVSS